MSTPAPPEPTPVTPRRPPTAVDARAEAYLDALAALDPVAATFMGMAAHAERLTDLSPDGWTARADLARATLRDVRALPPADDVDAVTLAALEERLTLTLDVHEAGLDQAELNNIACPVQSVREVFDVARTGTADDWEAIAERLHAVPWALRGYRESLRRSRERGWVPARRQVLAAAGQAEQFGAPDGFFPAFVAAAAVDDGTRLPGPLTERLRQGASAAARAYGKLDGWLRGELLPTARADDAAGPDVYAIAARGFLGARIDFAETYAWAVDELARIERRMAEVARLVVPGETATGPDLVASAVAALDADPARTIEGSEAFRAWMQQLSDEAVSALAGNHFDIAEPLRRLACRIAPSSSGGVYYTGPSEDLTRPGQMWWSVPPGTTSFSTWRERSTVYHEGVPGHHLQIGQAMYLAGSLNRWRRMGVWVSGHGEGWALYAERLMAELGFLEDPADLLGMLDAHALRACRVIVDIGVHLRLPAPAEVGGGTWDADKAWQFLTTHTRVPEPTRRFELERYLGWPSQAISYKVGERTWLDLRARAQARAGADFDLRTFHARALDLGSVGLDVLTTFLLPS